ncbi:MAG: hypothetical protein FJZ95_07525 [Chloroflexi bacterium]|nr:hypothetical protein [Chloroflexota bacterium]
MQAQLRGGYFEPGGIRGYPLDQLFEEVAYLAYYLHWPLGDIMEMEHDERREWVEQIAEINRRLSEGE